MRTAAITGMGIVSCLGTNLAAVTENLKNGHSGIAFDENRKALGFKSPLAALVPDVSAQELNLSRKTMRTMCEPALFSIAAAKKAVANATAF